MYRKKHPRRASLPKEGDYEVSRINLASDSSDKWCLESRILSFWGPVPFQVLCSTSGMYGLNIPVSCADPIYLLLDRTTRRHQTCRVKIGAGFLTCFAHTYRLLEVQGNYHLKCIPSDVSHWFWFNRMNPHELYYYYYYYSNFPMWILCLEMPWGIFMISCARHLPSHSWELTGYSKLSDFQWSY